MDLHGSRLRVQRTRRGKRFGGKNQDRKWSSFVNPQVLEKEAEKLFEKNLNGNNHMGRFNLLDLMKFMIQR